MSLPKFAFLALLEQAAVAAQQEELRFRSNVAREIAARERERQFAFRRVEIAKAMAHAAASTDSLEQGVAQQVLALRRELGWHGDSEQRRAALDAWKPVAEAIWRSQAPGESGDRAPPSVQDAMAQFESWYTGTFGSNYLSILDREIPEMPVVEF